VHLCERRASKYKVSEPGIDMIHRLDIHGPNEGTNVCEDLAGSEIAKRVEEASAAIREHVAAVANVQPFKRCGLSFRVRVTLRADDTCAAGGGTRSAARHPDARDHGKGGRPGTQPPSRHTNSIVGGALQRMCAHVQMNANSTLHFVGCVQLRLAERVFELSRHLSTRQNTLGSRQPATKLERLMTKVQMSGGSAAAELSSEDIAEPINCDATSFVCAVTGAANAHDSAYHCADRQLLPSVLRILCSWHPDRYRVK
jgi:hypothetical protein